MSSPANTHIYFQLTGTVVNDEKQTNITSMEKKILLFVNMNIKINTQETM